LLIYVVGIIVTAFLSNDATAVVMTPAVFAVARAAGAEPLPLLLICAFIANAASFVLPISNPANLVLYASHLPPLPAWLARFAVPSALSILATFVALRLLVRKSLRTPINTEVQQPQLSLSGGTAACGIVATAILLLFCSALDLQLGLPACIAGAVTAALVLFRERQSPWGLLSRIHWAIIPLVAGLFVLVEALARTGILTQLAALLRQSAAESAQATAWRAGVSIAFGCNFINNLPAGLIASSSVAAAHSARQITDALLIGVDLGPNLSVTGSLATILWLAVLRREGLEVGFWSFLARGLVVMPPALLLALAGLLMPEHLTLPQISGGTLLMSAILVYPIIIAGGVLQALGPPMNAQLRISLANPWFATVVSFAVVLFLFLIVWAVQPWPVPTARGLQAMPWWAPLGGVIGAFAVVAGLFFVDRVGAGAYAGLTISANLIMSILIDRFGLLNMPAQTVSPVRILGAILMIGGVFLICRYP
ncbi:MAG: DMT family transporter, partial [Acetobacteraceae bacterium]|nr:DMT family transporter [Acetobacteraceae bacterium]